MTATPYSVVVVTWQCAAFAAALVETMNRWLDGTQQLVVIDNGSTDGVEAAVRAWRGPSHFERLSTNAGFGAAVNVGVERAGHDVVVMLNPDVELRDASLDELAASALELNALVGPRVLNPDGSIQASASGPEVGAWPWVRACLPGNLAPRFIVQYTEPYRCRERTSVSWLTGACIAGPRSVLMQLGPFDPHIHLYGEDLDLGLRAQMMDVPSYFCPETCSVVHHGGGASTVAFGSPEGWRLQGASNFRAVLRRTYGRRRETGAWCALTLNLALRAAAKRALGRATRRDRAALSAVWRARPPADLAPNSRTV
jgi:N-acetylglucosaminyl-diphospho-decaprenol L-rhamnosyltransferase